MKDRPHPDAARPFQPRPWSLVGAAVGFALGVLDFAVLSALGVEVRWGEDSALVWVAAFFAVSFAALGHALGQLVTARQTEAHHRAVITTQLDELHEAQARLVEAETLAGLGRMAAGVAHEVRNPLGVMRTSTSLLAEMLAATPEDAWPQGATRQDAEATVQFLTDEITRLSAVTAALLDFARPVDATVAPADLATLHAEVVQAIESAGATSTGEQVNTCQVRADPALVVQILRELVGNARQAIDESGVGGQVQVALSMEAGNATWTVRDDGPGLSPELEGAVGQPFRTTRAKGTGLGLAMAMKLARAQGGELVPLGTRAGLGPDGRGAAFALRLEEAA